MTNYKLNNQNLVQLPEQVSVPDYDRTDIKASIVHVGIGGFHRSHQARYADLLLRNGSSKDCGICGVALMDFDKKIYNTLNEQDGLYTLIIKELDGSLRNLVIGSMVEWLFAPENPRIVVSKMASPDVKIITLTITEGGYNYDEAIGGFNFENPLIKHDLENSSNPKTIFGYLTQALKKRKERGLDGITIQSCDNIQGNGDVTKSMLLSYVEVAEPGLLDWITEHVSFPNSMVDRITPSTTAEDIDHLKQTTGLDDQWPVVCESFKQWVIEDNFIAGRPAWEQVGAQFVTDVAPYEVMKLSLLNAGHSVLGILGALMGFSTIDQALDHDAIKAFLKLYMDDEVTPILKDLEGIDLEDYKDSLNQRFGNKYMKDQIVRICSESSAKIPIFILPTIAAQLEGENNIKYGAYLIAAWAQYSLGKDERENDLEIKDVMKEALMSKALESKTKPEIFLELESIFGQLTDSKEFREAYCEAYENISQYGVEKSLNHIICNVKNN